MKIQPRQNISNKYNTCPVVTSPVYIGSKILYSTILIFAIFYFKSLRFLLYQFCTFILI